MTFKYGYGKSRISQIAKYPKLFQAVGQQGNEDHMLSSNSITSICCGFVVQKVVQQIHNKSM